MSGFFQTVSRHTKSQHLGPTLEKAKGDICFLLVLNATKVISVKTLSNYIKDIETKPEFKQ